MTASEAFTTARAGTYLVRVRDIKESMGERFAITDGGTHHHMAAVGLGSFVRRNFPIELVGRTVPDGVLNEDDVAALELAVNEAASNIMKHAYHGRTDQWIQLDADAFPGRVSIRLHHLGDSFDPAAVSPPALDGSRESGFGVFLITESVDELRYSRDERGRHCITLVKVFSSESRSRPG